MKAIILAAGQGTRLRPLTDEMPKCMVKINGKSMIERTLDTMERCGISQDDISVVTGYKSNVLKAALKGRQIHDIYNRDYQSTNMVCSLMCAKELMQMEDDIIVSYGDIIYDASVLKKIMEAPYDLSVTVDDGWYEYWSSRCDNPLEDAESLLFDKEDHLQEIGQKTLKLSDIQAQYIGLMHFRKDGIKKVLHLCEQAEQRSERGLKLWRTDRKYQSMYMTDLLQGLIDEGNKVKAVHINRGWYEVDCLEDLQIAERELI